MKKTVSFAVLFVFVLSGLSLADVVYLKNGNKITGQIIERTAQEMKINVKGVDLTYFNDEIDRVEPEGASTSSPSLSSTQENAPQLPSVSTPVPSSIKTLDSVPGLGDRPFDSALNSSGKDELIVKLIEVSGAKENMQVMFDKMLKESPPEESAVLAKILNLEEIVRVLIPVYDKYFAIDELKELVSFYESPIGVKFLRITPDLVQDTMKASMAYFQKKIEEEGVEPTQAP